MHKLKISLRSSLTTLAPMATAISLTLAMLLSTVLATVMMAAPAQAQGCVQVDWDPNSCSSGAINHGSVDIWGQQTNQGADPGSGGGTGSSGYNGGDASGDVSSREPTFFDMCMRDSYFATAVVECWDVIGQWRQEQAVTPATPPAPRIITLSDLASFTPQGVSLSLQPGSWTVVGVETNFIAGAQTHVVSGSLLGRSAEVRFTPAYFDWNYGDGATRSTSGAGASWSVLGVKEFSRTSTSHVYRSPGSYNPSVTVYYAVEYRWGGGAWVSVAGRIPASASASTVTAYTADTVLVTGSCTTWKVAPGC